MVLRPWLAGDDLSLVTHRTARQDGEVTNGGSDVDKDSSRPEQPQDLSRNVGLIRPLAAHLRPHCVLVPDAEPHPVGELHHRQFPFGKVVDAPRSGAELVTADEVPGQLVDGDPATPDQERVSAVAALVRLASEEDPVAGHHVADTGPCIESAPADAPALELAGGVAGTADEGPTLGGHHPADSVPKPAPVHRSRG